MIFADNPVVTHSKVYCLENIGDLLLGTSTRGQLLNRRAFSFFLGSKGKHFQNMESKKKKTSLFLITSIKNNGCVMRFSFGN